jgi:hypothetical protein
MNTEPTLIAESTIDKRIFQKSFNIWHVYIIY